jgi:hypothetical protein
MKTAGKTLDSFSLEPVKVFECEKCGYRSTNKRVIQRHELTCRRTFTFNREQFRRLRVLQKEFKFKRISSVIDMLLNTHEKSVIDLEGEK